LFDRSKPMERKWRKTSDDIACKYVPPLLTLTTALIAIDGQMGQARWFDTETARKSTALEQADTEGVVPQAGPTRLLSHAWAATSARRPNTGTTRNWAGLMSARQF
jgi:hypothetical protein